MTAEEKNNVNNTLTNNSQLDISGEKGEEASRFNPCPLCDSDHWCFHVNEDTIMCSKTDEAPEGWVKTGQGKKDGRNIFAKKGSQKRQRYGSLPTPEEILPLALDPKTDSPQWVTLSKVGLESELQIEYMYPNPETGEPQGKVVRKQWSDRRAAYGRGRKDTKEIRPWHWAKPSHPDMLEGWWSDRGKGEKEYGYMWPLYRQEEITENSIAIDAPGELNVEIYRELGFPAFCSQGGEGSYIAQTVGVLREKEPKLIIIPGDNDETGRRTTTKKLKEYARANLPAVAIDLKNVYPDLREKGDIYNVVMESGMERPLIIERLEAEIHRALSARHAEKQAKNKPNLEDGSELKGSNWVGNGTVEALILNNLFRGENNQWATIEDTFYRDSKQGYWQRVPDKPVLRAIALQCKSAYELREKQNGEIIQRFPFFTNAKQKSAFQLCRDALDISGNLPSSSHLRCFKNCTVDLRTGEAIPHNKEHYLTTVIASDYTPNQPCPEIFLQFIKSAYGADLVEVIRAYTSMLLDPTAPYGKFIHLMGASGSGKGTLLRLWGEMFDVEHSRSGDFNNLSTAEGRHQYLTGAALYTVPDVGGFVQGLKAFYELVDNGPMTGRALFSSNAYQKQWGTRFVIASVDHLNIENSGDGWNRRCLPLPTKPREGIEDPNLGTKLAEVKGQIISWALAMPREERDRLILFPSTNERVQMLKQDAALHGDPLRAFLDMCLRPCDTGEEMESHNLHSLFSAFAQTHGYQGWGMTRLIHHLRTILPDHFVPRRRSLASENLDRDLIPAHWKGITLLPEAFRDISEKPENGHKREHRWVCIKAGCREGGLAAFENFKNGSGGSHTPHSLIVRADPSKSPVSEAFQENGSGGSGGSHTPFYQVIENFESIAVEAEIFSTTAFTTPSPVADPPDPLDPLAETLDLSYPKTDQYMDQHPLEVADPLAVADPSVDFPPMNQLQGLDPQPASAPAAEPLKAGDRVSASKPLAAGDRVRVKSASPTTANWDGHQGVVASVLRQQAKVYVAIQFNNKSFTPCFRESELELLVTQ